MRKLYSGTPAGTSLGRDAGGRLDTGVAGGGGIPDVAAGAGVAAGGAGAERLPSVVLKANVKGIVDGIVLTLGGLSSFTLQRCMCGSLMCRCRCF